MAAPEQLTDVEELIRCTICLNSFRDPRQLPCRHVFCFECIDSHFRFREDNSASCPICRVPFRAEGNDANNLPKTVYNLQQIINLANRLCQKCEETNCTSETALFLCLRCRKWVCDTCKSQRCLNTESEDDTGHEAYLEKDIDFALLYIVTRSRSRHCHLHRTHNVEWYCSECAKLVCKLCKSNDHLSHTLTDVKDKSRDIRELLVKAVASLSKQQEEHQRNYKFYNNISHVQLINSHHCRKMSQHCKVAVANCGRLVQMITQLLTYGSNETIIRTFLLRKDQIDAELMKRYSMEEELREVQKCSCGGNDLPNTVSPMASVPTDSPRSRHNSLDSAIFVLNVDRPSVCESPKCTNKEKAVLFICLRCRKWLCRSCKGRRCSDGLPPDQHDAVRPSDINRTLYDIVIRSRHDTCNVHPEHDIDKYCCTCKVLICQACHSGHLHHKNTKVTDKSRECCEKMEHYQEMLQKQIKDYSTSREMVLKLQEEEYCSEVLSSSYCNTVVNECDSGVEQCNVLHRDITSLLLYGSHRVIIEMFAKMETHIEIELKNAPLVYLTKLGRLASVINDTVDVKQVL